MSGQAVIDHVARLNLSVQELEVRIESGAVPPSNLGDVKSAIDDVRLRIWGLLNASHAQDLVAFQERFVIRRTRELVSRVEATLRRGQMREHTEELDELRDAALRLTHTVDTARPEHP